MMAAGGAIVPPASSRHASVVPLDDHMLGARAVAVLDVDIADMAYAPARPRRDLRHVAGRTALDPAGLRRASRPLRRATRSNKSRCRATSTRPRRFHAVDVDRVVGHRHVRVVERRDPGGRSPHGSPLSGACVPRSIGGKPVGIFRQSSRASADAARPAPPGLPHRACRRPPASSPALLDLFPLLFRGRVRFRVLHCTSLSGRRAHQNCRRRSGNRYNGRCKSFMGLADAHVSGRTCQPGTAPFIRRAHRRATGATSAHASDAQPPLAPPGAETAPGMLAPLSPLPAARCSAYRRRGGRCGRHAAVGSIPSLRRRCRSSSGSPHLPPGPRSGGRRDGSRYMSK